MSAAHEAPRADAPASDDVLRAAQGSLAVAELRARATGTPADDAAVLDACDDVFRARVVLGLRAMLAGAPAAGDAAARAALSLDSQLPLLSSGGCPASPRT